MYSYFYGKIISVNKRTITIEVNNIGYVVFTPNPDVFNKEDKIHLYVYGQYVSTNKNSFVHEIYGFKTYEEKELFLSLLKCQGIGPKTSLLICSNNISFIKELIVKKDEESLAKCKGVTLKTAHAMIDSLHELYSSRYQSTNNNLQTSEVFSALKALGYSDVEINYAIDKLLETSNEQVDKDISTLISNAIKIIINKGKEQVNELNK